MNRYIYRACVFDGVDAHFEREAEVENITFFFSSVQSAHVSIARGRMDAS